MGTPETADTADAAARLAQITAATDVAEVRRLYDDWAATYEDVDVAGLMGHPDASRVADVVTEIAGPGADVLDAACGTGLVGAELAERGFTSIDGLDLSPGMIHRARRRRVYHDLGPADLRDGVPGASAKFDVVTCRGGFAPGHLGPRALTGFARVVRVGGVLVAAVDDATWAAHGYAEAVDRLRAQGLVRPVERSDPGLLVLEVRGDVPASRSVPWSP
ncbi:class I SAM-dependent DNA methyltransferase [Actinomycetospora sp. CA-101289]|uniref:class I SAM-dependent DNA methyltransferase n=1 Tax=Actinomycetospora sp. CA-101289 TaxID=3239893 RepID=UPI003D9731F1